MKIIKKILFKIARSSTSSLFIGFIFEYLAGILPLDRIFLDENVIVFKHPVPFWKTHYLAVPRRKIFSFLHLDLSMPKTKEIIVAILSSLQTVAKANNLVTYRIIVNGGDYQDVPQLHFHLCDDIIIGGGESRVLSHVKSSNENLRDKYQSALLYKHTNPNRHVHYMLVSNIGIPSFNEVLFFNQTHKDAIIDILLLAQKTINENKLTAYSLIIEDSIEYHQPELRVHLVSA